MSPPEIPGPAAPLEVSVTPIIAAHRAAVSAWVEWNADRSALNLARAKKLSRAALRVDPGIDPEFAETGLIYLSLDFAAWPQGAINGHQNRLARLGVPAEHWAPA